LCFHLHFNLWIYCHDVWIYCMWICSNLWSRVCMQFAISNWHHHFFNKTHLQGLHNNAMMLYISSWLFARKHCDNIKMLFYHSCFWFITLTILLRPWTNGKLRIWKIFNFTHACFNITFSRLDRHIINMPHRQYTSTNYQ
jgi:hypothetical protein